LGVWLVCKGSFFRVTHFKYYSFLTVFIYLNIGVYFTSHCYIFVEYLILEQNVLSFADQKKEQKKNHFPLHEIC